MGRRQWANDSTVCVKMSANASVTLIFKGNLFDLTVAERQLISDLSEIIQRHEGVESDQGATA